MVLAVVLLVVHTVVHTVLLVLAHAAHANGHAHLPKSLQGLLDSLLEHAMLLPAATNCHARLWEAKGELEYSQKIIADTDTYF